MLLTGIQNGVSWIRRVDGQRVAHPGDDGRRRSDRRAEKNRAVARLDHLRRGRLSDHRETHW